MRRRVQERTSPHTPPVFDELAQPWDLSYIPPPCISKRFDTTHSATPDETREYTVAGMTCSHRALSVREEVPELAAVETVDVDCRRLTVSGSGIDDDAVRAAVAEAGYEVVSVNGARPRGSRP